jgi:hypothetical protein
MTAHTIFIIIPAVFGFCAFLFGCLVFEPSLKKYKFNVFYYSLLLLILSLFTVMVIDSDHLLLKSRITDSLLVVLAVYTFYRARLAKTRIMDAHRIQLSNYIDYIDDIGFTLISLFVGFVIAGAIDVGTPGWLIGLIGLSGIVAGINAVTYKKSRLINELKPAEQ